jgi:hypothetical protein
LICQLTRSQSPPPLINNKGASTPRARESVNALIPLSPVFCSWGEVNAGTIAVAVAVGVVLLGVALGVGVASAGVAIGAAGGGIGPTCGVGVACGGCVGVGDGVGVEGGVGVGVGVGDGVGVGGGVGVGVGDGVGVCLWIFVTGVVVSRELSACKGRARMA